jgi:ubiquinone/menaquinone biosynthesis C-methylase UbiE
MSSRRDVWDAGAQTYDQQRLRDDLYHRCVELARREVERARPLRVLDIGCGTGLTTLPLCRHGRQVFACDYSLASIKALTAKSMDPVTHVSDIRALPFPRGLFDVVLCANILQHLSPADQPKAIAEVQRVLRPNGRLVLTVHHYSNAKRRLGWIKEGKPGQPEIDYIYRFTRNELAALLPRADILAIGLPPKIDHLRMPAFLRRWFAAKGHGYMLMAVQ